MKCKHCDGTGIYTHRDNNGKMTMKEQCRWCNGSGKDFIATQTNEEWFDTLSTKEKAEWLDKVAEDCCQLCDEERREFCNKCIARDCEFENAKKWEIWLKQPHSFE